MYHRKGRVGSEEVFLLTSNVRAPDEVDVRALELRIEPYNRDALARRALRAFMAVLAVK